MTRNSVNPIYADITSIDRGKAGVYSVRGSSTWKTIDVMKSWRYHSSLYSPRFTPKKRKLFPLSKGNGIECLENYHRSSVSNFDAGQPPRFLPPKLFHSIGENSFICRLSLSLSSLNSRSSSFLVRGNSMFRLKQRRIEKWGWTGSFSKLFRMLRDGSKRYGNFDQNRWGYRCFIIRNRIVCISEDCINTIIGTMFLEGVSIVF